MDDSFNLARHVARFVSLLMRQPNAVDQQKLELRTLALITKEGTLRLTTRSGQLMANGLAVPAALTGVRDTADQMIAHRIGSIELTQALAAGELLAIGRLIVAPPSDNPRAIHDKIRALDAKTVLVQPVADEEAAPRTAEHAVVVPEPSPGTPARVPFLLARANAEGETPGVAAVFEEVAFAVEQATREGRTDQALDTFTQLIVHEHGATDTEVRRHFVLAIRRLMKPPVLRPIARLVAGDSPRADDALTILTRCGTDGADAVADQLAGATTLAEQEAFRAALNKLPAVDASLIAMLNDARPHVVRMAAELLAARTPADGDSALADHINDADVRVRRAVVRALGAYDTPFSLDAIARAFDDPVVEVRLEAVAVLAGRRGSKVGDIIGRAMDDEEDAEVQFGMLGALGRIGTPDAVARLAKAAESGGSGLFAARKGSAVRVAAVRALAEARTPGAMSVLKTLVNDKEREVRDAAMQVIGR